MNCEITPSPSNNDGVEDTANIDAPDTAFDRIQIWHVIVASLLAIAGFIAFELAAIALKLPLGWRRSLREWVFYLWLAGYVGWAHSKQSLDLSRLVAPIYSKASISWLLIYLPFLISNHYLGHFRLSYKLHQISRVDVDHPYLTFIHLVPAVIIAPVIEEILFRGILLHRASLVVGTNRAIILVSMAFGLGHNAFIQAFVFGVLMSLLYIRTGSLIVPIIFHILNNGVANLGDIYPAVNHGLAQLESSIGWVALGIVAIAIFILWPRPNAVLPYFRLHSGSDRRLEGANLL